MPELLEAGNHLPEGIQQVAGGEEQPGAKEDAERDFNISLPCIAKGLGFLA